MQANCGLVIDGETLINQNGVLTLVDYEGDANRVYSSICGGLCYDSNVFKIEKGIITMKDDEKEEFESILIASCGVKLDGNYFELQNGKLVSTYEPMDWLSYFYASQDEPIGSVSYTISDRYRLTKKPEKEQRIALYIHNSSGNIISNMSFEGFRDRWTKSSGDGEEFVLYTKNAFTSSPKEESSYDVYSTPMSSMTYKTLMNILAFDSLQSASDYVKTGVIDESHIVTL